MIPRNSGSRTSITFSKSSSIVRDGNPRAGYIRLAPKGSIESHEIASFKEKLNRLKERFSSFVKRLRK